METIKSLRDKIKNQSIDINDLKKVDLRISLFPENVEPEAGKIILVVFMYRNKFCMGTGWYVTDGGYNGGCYVISESNSGTDMYLDSNNKYVKILFWGDID